MLSEEMVNKIYNDARKNNETLILAGHGDGRNFTTIAGEGADVFIKIDEIINSIARAQHTEIEEVIKDIVEIHRFKTRTEELFDKLKGDDFIDFGEM